MKKNIFSIILLISVIAIPAYATELPDFPFIFAQGQSEIEMPPDIVTVSFYVEIFDENPSNAQTTVRERNTELLDFFSEKNINKKDITAYEFTKNTIRDKQDYTELKILGYEIRRKFSVTIRDLSIYEQFMEKLLTMENITHIETQFDRTDREKIEENLIAQAGQNAKEQAKKIAKGFGVELGTVYAISQQGFYNLGAEFSLERDRTPRRKTPYMESDFLFVPSTVTFYSGISAIFKIKTGE